MDYKNIETQVKKQSELLEKEIQKLVESSSALIGKYMAYFNGDTAVADNHYNCFKEAEKKFGDSGFAIAKVEPSKKLVLSALIKLSK